VTNVLTRLSNSVLDQLSIFSQRHPGAGWLLRPIVKRQHLIRQFVKFGIVGTIGAGVDFGTLVFLHELLKINLYIANTISFSAAVLSNFTWNSLWTFRDVPSGNRPRQLVQFFIISLIGLGINQLLLFTFYDLIGLKAFRFGYLVAKAMATLIVMGWNFIGNKLWTFRRR